VVSVTPWPHFTPGENRSINISDIEMRDFLIFINAFSSYFLSVAKNISSIDGNYIKPLQYLKKAFLKFSGINLVPTAVKDINTIVF
jgi:hypothetical protein